MTDTEHIAIRSATIGDALLVARTVLRAVDVPHPDEKGLAKLAELCRQPNVLYSWSNSDVALFDGVPVGAITAYNGADYPRLRANTFPILQAITGYDFNSLDQETTEGEYYIDSVAVDPEHRHKGVGTALLSHAIAKAKVLGAPLVTLVVDPDNPSAMSLYQSLGFETIGRIRLFTEYVKLGCRLT